MNLRAFLFFMFCSVSVFVFAQKTNIDSLLAVWNNKNMPDTVRLKAIDDVAWEGYLFSDPDSAFYFAQLEYNFAEKKNQKIFLAKALSTQAYSFGSRGDNLKAIEYNMRALKIKNELKDKKGIAASLNNVGGIYGAMGNFSKAIDCYIQSLKILEDLKDKKGLTGVLDNIGTLYFYQGNYPVAIDYENRSIKLAKEINDKEDLQYALNNIALIYQIQKDFDTAIALYKQSLKISEEADNKTLMLTTLDNIGNTYYSKGDTTLALGYYNKCLKSAEEINDKSAVAGVLNNIGNVYKDARNYKRSIEYSTKALSLANETGEAAQIREASNSLYLSYKNTGEYTKALAMHELYTSTVDSITSSESKKEIVRQEFKYEYEKKTAADSVRTIEKNKLIAIQFKEAETQRYALYGGVLLLFIFGGFMFNRYRITQKQKSIIELQKNLVEEKQREILDSIYYARRIQRSLLPTEKYIHKNLKRLNVK